MKKFTQGLLLGALIATQPVLAYHRATDIAGDCGGLPDGALARDGHVLHF